MIQIEKATIDDLQALVRVDCSVIGHDGRKGELTTAVHEKRCLIAKTNSSAVGFLVYHTQFFGCSFIELVIVTPTERRNGNGSALITRFEQIAPTCKIFSSTNESNKTMQNVFSSLGYVKSGWVDNLDEGDPEIIYFKKLDIEI